MCRYFNVSFIVKAKHLNNAHDNVGKQNIALHCYQGFYDLVLLAAVVHLEKRVGTPFLREWFSLGTVTESSPDKSRLNLSTDGVGEAADSWHSRPIFYSGGGAGYSGRPEVGDTMYLYFPSEDEESRSVIAGGGAGYKTLHSITQQVMNDTAAEEEEAKKSQPLPMGVENQEIQENQEMPETVQSMSAASQQPATGKIKTASASNMPGYKNWSTPKKQGVSLNPGGVRLQTGSKTAIGMGNGGISLTSKGDAALKGKRMELRLRCSVGSRSS